MEESKKKSVINFRMETAVTFQDKLTVLEERDKYLRNKMQKNKSVHGLSGTCPDMCPEKERLLRELRCSFSIYESTIVGNERHVVPELLVKEYARSSADQDIPLAHELRPEPVLTMTMDYIIRSVMSQISSLDENTMTPTNIEEWYNFCWDRLRSVRKDIIQQQLCNQKVVAIVEQCAKFHIWCYDAFCGHDKNIFEDKINTENLVNCLQLLGQMYDDLSKCNICCPNEAEFRIYMALLQLNESDIMWMYPKLSTNMRLSTSDNLRQVGRIFIAYTGTLYTSFFSLLEKTSYLNACILQRYINNFRIRALKVMVDSHCSGNKYGKFSLLNLKTLLKFDHLKETYNFLEKCGFVSDNSTTTSSSNAEVVISKSQFFIPPHMELRKSCSLVTSKRIPLLQIMLEDGSSPPTLYHSYMVHSSFSKFDKLNKDAFDATDQKRKLFKIFKGYNPLENNISNTNNNYTRKSSIKKTFSNFEEPEEGEIVSSESEDELDENAISSSPTTVSEDSEDESVVHEQQQEQTGEYNAEIQVDSASSSLIHNHTDNDDIIMHGDEIIIDMQQSIPFTTVKQIDLPIATSKISSPKSSFAFFGIDSVNTDTNADEESTGSIDNFEYESPNNKYSIKYLPSISYLNNNNSQLFRKDLSNLSESQNLSKQSKNSYLEYFNNNSQKPPNESNILKEVDVEFINESNANFEFKTMQTNSSSKLNNLDEHLNEFLNNMKNFKMELNKISEQSYTNSGSVAIVSENKKLIKIVNKNLKNKNVLKYCKLWREKIKKRVGSVKIQHLSVEEYLKAWGTQDHFLIPRNTTKRAEDHLVMVKKITSMLNSDAGTLKFIGNIFADILSNGIIDVKSNLKTDILFWKALISLPSLQEPNYLNFVQKLREICEISFYKNQKLGHVDNWYTSAGIKVSISLDINCSLNFERFTASSGVAILISEKWESLQQVLERIDKIIDCLYPNQFSLIISILDDELTYQLELMKYLNKMRKRRILTNFYLIPWKNFYTIFEIINTLCQIPRTVPELKIEWFTIFIENILTDFFSTLSGKLQENSAHNCPNFVIKLYNNLLLNLKNILLENQSNFKHFVPIEFIAHLKPNKAGNNVLNNLENLDFICQVLNKLQLPFFKKWPPKSVDKMMKLLNIYCSNLDKHGSLLPNVLRMINPSTEWVQADIFKPNWIEIVEIWANYNQDKISFSDNNVKNILLCFKVEHITNLTQRIWLLNDNNAMETD